MPVLWLAAFGAVVLLVRRTWKASKKRRVAAPADELAADNDSPVFDTGESAGGA
jgi:hypothetical protein